MMSNLISIPDISFKIKTFTNYFFLKHIPIELINITVLKFSKLEHI